MVLLPCAVSSTWTWVNQPLTLVHDLDDTGPPPTCTSRLWVTWDIYEWDLLCHREAVLSGLGTFWKRSVSRSFLGVFSGCLVWFLLGCCLLFVCLCWLKTPSFLLSPILQHVGIANQRQNVLMTVWASSAHGMSSQKKIKVQLTTIDAGVALFLPTQLTTIEVGPGLGIFFSSFSPSSPLFPPLWPPRPLESKVIQIQSDHLLAASPPVAAMERSKVTCSIQVCWRKLGPHQEGLLWPSHEVHWIPCWLGSYFSSSSLMLLFYTNDLLTFEMDKSTWCLKRVWSPSSAPPFSLHQKSVWVATWRHYSLFFPNSLSSMCCSFLPSSSWEDTACTGDDFRDAYSLGATDCVSGFPPFGHLFYNGLAGPRYLLEKNIWEDSECCSLHALSFVSRGFTKSWVGQVALRSPINRHAVDLTVSLDDQGH